MKQFIQHQRAGVRWALICGVWIVYALVMTSQTYFAYMREGSTVPLWMGAVLPSFVYSVLWMALTPLVLYLAARFPLDRLHRKRSLPVHVVASLVIAFTQRFASDAISMFLRASEKWPFSFDRVFASLIGFFDYGLLVYWIILLMHQALEYTRRIQQEEIRASQLQTQLAEAQLQTLKMQLHPHFLFNTLHSISALVHEDVEAADTMIARLGDFLRLTLENSGAQMVTLRSDLESMRCYFEIERTRFQQGLSLELEVEPETLDALVPSFLWQPIVENSIHHGIATSGVQGRITVKARSCNGILRMQVEDNGSGLSLDDASEPRFKEGIGLANTRAILQHIYGPAHRLDLANAPGGGAVVTLEIPFKTNSGPDHTNGGSNSRSDR